MRPDFRPTTALILVLCAALAVFAIFALAPELDLRAAALFYAGGFPHPPALKALRTVFYVLPFVILVGALGLWAAGRYGLIRPLVSNASAFWLVAAMALGPGLVVNVVLKDHSHRPRPAQTQEFGGKDAFRPVGRFDGACVKNCSFVSGEASSAAWTLAPALLVPAPLRAAAVFASLAFAAATGLLRMAFGGHYLSDVLLAILLTIALVLATRPFFLRDKRPPL